MKQNRNMTEYEITNLLKQYDINLKQLDIQQLCKKQASILYKVNTFGICNEQQIKFIEQKGIIQINQLQTLLNQYLKIYFLYDAIIKTLNYENKNLNEVIKVISILKCLCQGQFYLHLKQNIIINNRTTKNNVNIAIASLIIFCLGKLNMEQIRQSLTIFTLEQKELQTLGIFYQENIILNLLKKINKTINVNFLRDWMLNNTTQIQNFMLPHQFLYLVCQSTQRDIYLKKINQINFKNIKQKDTRLYLIQPLKEIYGTPDFKIQQMLNAQNYVKKIPKAEPLIATNQVFNGTQMKKSESISRFKKLLRQQSIYQQIKDCLNFKKQKSESIKKCIAGTRSPSKNRPYSSVTPILRSFGVEIPKKQIIQKQNKKNIKILKKSKTNNKEQIKKLYKTQFSDFYKIQYE